MGRTLLTILSLAGLLVVSSTVIQAKSIGYDQTNQKPKLERKLNDLELFQLLNNIYPMEPLNLNYEDTPDSIQTESERPKPKYLFDKSYRISDMFHAKRSKGGRQGVRLHEGVDVATPNNTPIYSPWTGVITQSGWNGGYGRMIEVKTPDGLRLRIAHLLRRTVNEGDVIEAGQEIGFSGNSDGPHAHIEVIDQYGNPVNPLQYNIIP